MLVIFVDDFTVRHCVLIITQPSVLNNNLTYISLINVKSLFNVILTLSF